MASVGLVAADLADLHTSGFGNRVVGRGWISRAGWLLEPAGRCPEQGCVQLALIAEQPDGFGALLLMAKEWIDDRAFLHFWASAAPRSRFAGAVAKAVQDHYRQVTCDAQSGGGT